jgi:hypothetical protein
MAGVNQSARGKLHTVCPSQPLNHTCPAATATLPDFHLSFDCFASESRISNRHKKPPPVVGIAAQIGSREATGAREETLAAPRIPNSGIPNHDSPVPSAV